MTDDTDTDTPADDGTVAAVVRALAVLDALWGHMAHGLTLSEVARATREPKNYAMRALRSLAAAGYAERIPETERWRPSVRLAREATRVHRSLAGASARLAEITERVGPLA